MSLCVKHSAAAALLLVATGLPIMAAVVLPLAAAPVPGPGAPVLVIAPPWSIGAAQIARSAGGRPIGPTWAPMGALAVFDGPVPTRRIRDLGGWGVTDGARLARLCGVWDDA
ncbi:hypothetical protein [Pseudoponticoccus marisrubri]|uniref:Uncharacterized protein n=1 Tax=Pseudoponticoccus marisrubri TaxID=1685382 RepID=A0A0W7WM91_9RHOB|nr:hypothetical protein [Pseudoponticoccus marisrubri]KUF11624.1 hypothetical protein AVJ23_07675 [Pseudoponticoccus marisrubri]